MAGGRKPRPQTVIEAEMAVRHFTQLNGDFRRWTGVAPIEFRRTLKRD